MNKLVIHKLSALAKKPASYIFSRKWKPLFAHTCVNMNIYCILERNVRIKILTLNLAYLLSKSYDFGGT